LANEEDMEDDQPPKLSDVFAMRHFSIHPDAIDINYHDKRSISISDDELIPFPFSFPSFQSYYTSFYCCQILYCFSVALNYVHTCSFHDPVASASVS
jgi:hypothetical protein